MPCLDANKKPCGESRKQERPLPTLGKIVSAAKAILKAKRVEPEVVEARLKICVACEYARKNSAGYQWCALCGCIIDGRKGLTNLASYEEGDGVKMTHGCHHPGRAEGKGGWPVPAITPPPAVSEGANGNVGGLAGVPVVTSVEENNLVSKRSL